MQLGIIKWTKLLDEGHPTNQLDNSLIKSALNHTQQQEKYSLKL